MKYIIRQFGRKVFIKEVGEEILFTTKQDNAKEFDELETQNIILFLKLDHNLEFISEPVKDWKDEREYFKDVQQETNLPL